MKSWLPAKKSPAWSTNRPSPPEPTTLRSRTPLFMARPTNLTLCSFCGKSHAEVKKLIQGPGVYICDNCVLLCKSVLEKELAPEPKKSAASHTVPKPVEI